jgi:hypothetical protein
MWSRPRPGPPRRRAADRVAGAARPGPALDPGRPWRPAGADATRRPRGHGGAGSAGSWLDGRAADTADQSSMPWVRPAASRSARRAGGCRGGDGQLGAGRPGRRRHGCCSGGSSGAPWRVAAQQVGDRGRRPAMVRQQAHDQAGADAVGAVQQPGHIAGAAGGATKVGVPAGGRIPAAPRGSFGVWKLQRPTRLLRPMPPTLLRRYEQNLWSPAWVYQRHGCRPPPTTTATIQSLRGISRRDFRRLGLVLAGGGYFFGLGQVGL